jgi:hypothetical protein
VPVHDDRGIGLLLLQDRLDCRSHWRDLGIVERGLAEHRRKARSQQERIPLPQRDGQRIRQKEHHVAARLRAPRLEETDVAGRYVRFVRESQLAQIPGPPPVLQQWSDCRIALALRLCVRHADHYEVVMRARNELRRMNGVNRVGHFCTTPS